MRAPGPQVLAVDLGTSGMKVSLVGTDGTLTGWASEEIDLSVLPGGGAEQDPEAWWRALGACSRQLATTFPEHAREVRAVCCSTQGEGTIAIDAAGNPLTQCILWMDMRGERPLQRQFGGRPTVNGLAAWRMARWVRLTGGAPSATGKDPAAHMLLVRDTMPEVYARTAMFLNVPDYLNMRLTGVRAASVDSILTSWVTDNRDPANVSYHEGLVADCGIEREKLPDIVACTDVLGGLTPDAAEHLGLAAGVRVVAGSIDTTAAAIGAGTIRNGAAHLYLGTSSWIAAHVPRKKTDILHGIASVPCAQPDRYLLTALQATAGGNLTWLKDNVLGATDPMVAADIRGQFYDLSDQIVPTVPPGSNGVLYTPWIYGERAPVDDLNLRAGLFNVSLHNDRADILRAVFEGIAYNTRWLMKPVNSFVGSAASEIVIAGGGAQSSAWCQIMADTLGVPVVRHENPRAVNARGAGFIGAVGIGEIDFADVPALVPTERTFTPDPSATAAYDEGFATFVDLHKRLAPVYRRLAKRRAQG